MCQCLWIELFSDYDCEIRYHPSKANIVADALSRKERVKPKRVQAMNMTLHSNIKGKILVAQEEAYDESARLQKRLDEMIERRSDGALYYLDRIWVLLKGDMRTLIMDEAHKSKLKLNIRGRLTYSSNLRFLNGNRKEYQWTLSPSYQRLVTDDQSERTIQTLEDILRACVLDFKGSWDVHLPLVEFSYNNSYHSSVRCAPFEALYETTEKISQIKDRLKAVGDRQKSYADKRRKPLDFSVGDYVLLKVSPWKGVVRFGKKGKLAPRFVGPFEVIKKVGPVAYRLDLPGSRMAHHGHIPRVEIFKRRESSRSLSEVELPSSRFGGIGNVDLNSRGNVRIK
ncbi:putative reverse transcriptase domain-containing protein [Tanacetum coccineum]